MRIGEYEFPEKCPDGCRYSEDMAKWGQGSMCTRCPVLICSGDEPVVPPGEYREDWARDWREFFETGKEPELVL